MAPRKIALAALSPPMTSWQVRPLAMQPPDQRTKRALPGDAVNVTVLSRAKEPVQAKWVPIRNRISEYRAVSLKFVDVKLLLFADLARRRLRSQPPGPPPAELQQAKVDFVEAVISRNYRAAQAANAVIARYARPEPPLSAAERERRDQRHSALVNWLCALRELREEEARGVVRP